MTPKQVYLLFFFALIHYQCQPHSPKENTSHPTDSLTIYNSTSEKATKSKTLPNKDTIPFDQLTEEEFDALFGSKEPADAYQPKDDHFPTFDRSAIEAKLKAKVEQGKPLVAHIFVPLCDNDHQGIVPTSASLGNGFSLRTNLYWATSTGMKRWFKEMSPWRLLKSIKNVYGDSVVLERVVFERTYPNSAKVYLVADAYRGDKMYETVNEFLRAMSNNYTETIQLNDSCQIDIHGGADLVCFNGHNGFLDLYYNQPKQWFNETSEQKDMVAIACYANEYFEREAMRAKAYPIVRAISRLHPGAFVISGIIDDWAMLKTVEEMRLSAGRAYCKVHDCSIKTSKRLFYKGWKPENLTKNEF